MEKQKDKCKKRLGYGTVRIIDMIKKEFRKSKKIGKQKTKELSSFRKKKNAGYD